MTVPAVLVAACAVLPSTAVVLVSALSVIPAPVRPGLGAATGNRPVVLAEELPELVGEVLRDLLPRRPSLVAAVAVLPRLVGVPVVTGVLDRRRGAGVRVCRPGRLLAVDRRRGAEAAGAVGVACAAGCAAGEAPSGEVPAASSTGGSISWWDGVAWARIATSSAPLTTWPAPLRRAVMTAAWPRKPSTTMMTNTTSTRAKASRGRLWSALMQEVLVGGWRQAVACVKENESGPERDMARSGPIGLVRSD